MGYDRANRVMVLNGIMDGADWSETYVYYMDNDTWVRMRPYPWPIGEKPSMVYDEANGVMVYYGGLNWGGMRRETWTYNTSLNTWKKMSPTISPSATWLNSMVYDNKAALCLVYTGVNPIGWGAPTNETWTYNTSSDTWTNMTPTRTMTERSEPSLAFDRAHGTAVLFGGWVLTGYGYIDETYCYDLSGNAWTRLTPTPDGRSGAGFAIDNDHRVALMLGGWGRYNERYSETWTYDIAKGTWKLMSPAKTPGYRESHNIVYDRADGVFILYGGFSLEGYKGDTWTYNLSTDTWSNMQPYTKPLQRVGSAMAYDEVNRVSVMFGGGYDTWAPNDTWLYNYTQNTWIDPKPQLSPTPRHYGVMAYDRWSGEMLLFGGAHQNWYSLLTDTWTYNVTTNTWTNVTSPGGPPGRSDFAMASTGTDGTVLLYGGWDRNVTYYDDLWSFSFKTKKWTQLHPARTPTARSYHVMDCDRANGSLLLYSGWNSSNRICKDDVWAYDLKGFLPSGELTSRPIDTGGVPTYGDIHVEGEASANSTLRVQLRSADSEAGLAATSFAGPDGTVGTAYTVGSQRAWTSHDGHRWLQYRAVFTTPDVAVSPLLEGVAIDYNLIHSLDILSPAGGENWTGTKDIAWNATDPDGDTLTVSILLLNATGSTQLATDIPATPGTFAWDTMAVPDGEYRIRIIAKDDNASIPLSIELTTPPFTVFHPNHPPVVSLLSPLDDVESNVSAMRLEWEGSDDDGDALVYFILLASSSFDNTSLPISIATTSDTHYDATGLDNGTYHWTVVAFDGEANSSVPTVRSFTVSIPAPPVNHAPVASLLSPSDGITINNTSIELRWTGSDEDGDDVTFLLFLSPTEFTIATRPGPTATTDLTAFLASGLLNGTTYWWAVLPTDGLLDGVGDGVWRFTVDITYGNRAPDITSTPILDAMVGSTYSYNLTASDPDGDTVVLALVVAPPSMELNVTTWEMLWTPAGEGNFTVTVRAYDGKGGIDVQTFSVHVRPKPIPPLPKPPSCAVTSLANGTKMSAATTIQGTTVAGTYPVQLVQVRVDDSLWVNATGTTDWSYQLDPTGLPVGEHHLSVRAYDGISWSNLTGVDFTVEELPIGEEAAFPWWALGLLLVLVVVGAVVAIAMRRRREEPAEGPIGERVEGAETATPLEVSVEAEAGAEASEAPPAPVATATPVDVSAMAAAAPEAPRPSQAAPAPPEPVAAPEPPAPPKPTPVPVATADMTTAPAGFALEDVFLMYGDGRLIQHSTRRLRADMDVEVMTSMLKAVQDFVKDSIGAAEGAELGAMEYGESKIMLQKGRWVILAAVITGGEPQGFRDEMRAAISNIEGEYRPALDAWDGDTSALAGARKFMSQLGAYRVPEAAAGARTEVVVKGELEFYQGFVRLKVAVRNGMDTLIADASFKLVYKDSVLRLDHIEPAYPVKGDEVILGNIEPREKKTIAFYLDPQICTESFVEGVLTYKDARGMLETQKLPRKMASVVCPIMHTDENINTAMLRRMATEQLDKRDSKVFFIPLSITPEGAFEIGKSAMQHHDVRLVREFSEKEPYVAEAWYYGKVKGRDDRLALCVRVAEERRVLEFLVASSSTLMLTGMLAELKSDLNKELGALRGRPIMEQVTRGDEVSSMVMKRTLLDKAAEAEMGAEESELRR